MKFRLASIVLASAFLMACEGDKTEATDPVETEQVTKLRTQALEACNAQAEQVPEEMREQAAEICQCTVKNMDYAKFEELTLAGKDQEAMKLSLETAQKCGS